MERASEPLAGTHSDSVPNARQEETGSHFIGIDDTDSAVACPQSGPLRQVRCDPAIFSQM